MEGQKPSFCTYCGHAFKQDKKKSLPSQESQESSSDASLSGSATLIQGHQPEAESIQFTIGPYQILKAIGKGGMGEVFLAYDTTCGRRIALKRIRSDLVEHRQMHNRFLKEARITSQLTHPSIIPIYVIYGQDNLVYYTMPFVEGKTLKEILHKTRAQEKKGKPLDYIGGSIPALMRIFLSICQAIAYAHTKGVLHRDIKPENIIAGQFGEVLILDWGLAKLMGNGTEASMLTLSEEEAERYSSHPLHQLTRLGKVVGTVNYMAPERAMGNPATIQTDIYSLGVMLYQILTLRNPFKRGTLKEFRERMHLEALHDPLEIAPYREVPRVLARIAMKCLSTSSDQRYHSVNELIREIENYIEGRAEWFHIATLDIYNKSDWEFQENVLIAEHVAITRGMEIFDWVSLMISKSSFNANIKLEMRVRLNKSSHGIGFLLCVPEAAERAHLNDGYCLWLGSDQNPSTKLLRSTLEVLNSPEIFLQRGEWYSLKIEKFENNIYFYLNNILQFSYISHMPLLGTHIGILVRDDDFVLNDFNVYVSSQSVLVNCLALPDAFLAHKDYATALNEYRRIGYSFPGRTEGREAMFRAGITLLEQAKDSSDKSTAESLYDQALEEFEKLHGTPGAPLEYLGKALVYKALNDIDEEIKCFELAYRRYPRHPLLPILEEQILYRMHENSRSDRKAAYMFMLLTLRHLPHVVSETNTKKLFASLKKHWEPLPFFIDDPQSELSDSLTQQMLSIALAFWLVKPYVLEEVIHDLLKIKPLSPILISNALYALIEIGAFKKARELLNEILERPSSILQQRKMTFQLLETLLLQTETSWKNATEALLKLAPQADQKEVERAVFYFLTQATLNQRFSQVHQLYQRLVESKIPFSDEGKIMVDSFRVWAFLGEKKWDKANDLLYSYPLELLSQESNVLHFLYGCLLYATESKEIASIHFNAILETPFPRSWLLLNKLLQLPEDMHHSWLQKIFWWEKRQLYAQAALFYDVIGEPDKSAHYYNSPQSQ